MGMLQVQVQGPVRHECMSLCFGSLQLSEALSKPQALTQQTLVHPTALPPVVSLPTLQALISSEARLDLGAAVEATAAVQPIAVSAEHKAAVLEFIERRLEQLLVDAGVQVGLWAKGWVGEGTG